jgi:alkylhydroperoxidase family enzyme
VRFAVARHDGLTEELVDGIDASYASSGLSERHKATIALADAYLDVQGPPDAKTRERIAASLRPDEIVEVGIGLALFHGFSKLLIAVGAEPTDMETTILPTPNTSQS